MKLNKREFIAQDILSKIYQKKYIEKLPPQRVLASEYGVSRYTIQEALTKLIRIGVIYTVQGDGIYIHSNINNPLIYNSMTETPYKDIQSKLIYLKRGLPSTEIRKVFGIDRDEEIWEFQRIRIVQYQIAQLETSYLLVKHFPDLDEEAVVHSIQKYVKSKGYQISHFISNYQAININKEQAALFEHKRGTAAMLISNRGILDDGTIFEYSDIVALNYNCTYIIPFNEENHSSRLGRD